MTLVEKTWFNAVWFQTTWFSCVLGREDWMWLTAVLIAFHYAAVSDIRFQRPKKIIFGELPKTSTGKIRKNELRDRLR